MAKTQAGQRHAPARARSRTARPRVAAAVESPGRNTAPVAPARPVEEPGLHTADRNETAPAAEPNHPLPRAQWPMLAAAEYAVDAWQRWALLFDLLRQRGDNMLQHEAEGLPPLLAFSSEMVLDARQFSSPASYALVRIAPAVPTVEGKRPVIVFDPRAGHGPGIGGFREASEVGAALTLGHPVYFVIFFPEPASGQTLADVHHALRRFVAEVARLHPGPAPVLYGNCQAGWAVTLVSADCVGTAGPAVLNGSPLSYWAGAPGVNPMRLAGGLTGGAWLPHWLADLGNGRFDGAWLVQNFEWLKPGRAWFDKYASVYRDPDRESDRFLEFERWWSGFYFLSREEILDIVNHLFIGNRLEQGKFRICEACVADLRRIRNPLLIFASAGDNITPPAQALGWIRTVWSSTEALEAAGQRIAYLLHPDVGHLGIFVSAAVARREHHAMLAHIDALEALDPGFYEMTLSGTDASGRPQVAFHRRRIETLPDPEDSTRFQAVRERSEALDVAYERWISPWVRAGANPMTAWILKWLHPMRWERYRFATAANPLAGVVRTTAAAVRAHRKRCAPDNPWQAAEAHLLDSMSATLAFLTEQRDAASERWFEALYGQARADR